MRVDLSKKGILSLRLVLVEFIWKFEFCYEMIFNRIDVNFIVDLKMSEGMKVNCIFLKMGF